MLTAIIAGERSVVVLAQLARGRMRGKIRRLAAQAQTSALQYL